MFKTCAGSLLNSIHPSSESQQKKKKNLEKGGKNLNWETKNFIFLLTYENYNLKQTHLICRWRGKSFPFFHHSLILNHITFIYIFLKKLQASILKYYLVKTTTFYGLTLLWISISYRKRGGISCLERYWGNRARGREKERGRCVWEKF